MIIKFNWEQWTKLPMKNFDFFILFYNLKYAVPI